MPLRTTIFILLAALSLQARFRAGAAVAGITPEEWPVRVIGGFTLVLAQSAHDPLNVRALVVEEAGTRLAIAVIDSCYVKREEMDEAKRLASAKTGIPVANMLISATHSHSAPPSRAAEGDAREQRYVKRLVEQTAAAIGQANARLQPARIGFAVRMIPDEVFNRRWFMREGAIGLNPYGEPGDKAKMNPGAGNKDLVHPAGPTDPGFSIVSIRAADGRPLALLGNYSLHYVGGIGGNMLSADYFGEFARQVWTRLAPEDPNFVAILSNGTSGDVNNNDLIHPRPRAEPFARIREVAAKLAGHALDAAKTVEYRDEAPVRVARRELTLSYRKPTARQLEFAKAALQEPDESKLPIRAKAYAERAIQLEKGPAAASIVLQAVRIGSFAIAAIPCETFTETGLTIKELSAVKPVFTIELANGHYGYLPTPRHYDLGGYETWLGTNNLEKEASVKITRTILELLQQVAP